MHRAIFSWAGIRLGCYRITIVVSKYHFSTINDTNRSRKPMPGRKVKEQTWTSHDKCKRSNGIIHIVGCNRCFGRQNEEHTSKLQHCIDGVNVHCRMIHLLPLLTKSQQQDNTPQIVENLPKDQGPKNHGKSCNPLIPHPHYTIPGLNVFLDTVILNRIGMKYDDWAPIVLTETMASKAVLLIIYNTPTITGKSPMSPLCT